LDGRDERPALQQEGEGGREMEGGRERKAKGERIKIDPGR
jgi:hypothetical protein